MKREFLLLAVFPIGACLAWSFTAIGQEGLDLVPPRLPATSSDSLPSVDTGSLQGMKLLAEQANPNLREADTPLAKARTDYRFAEEKLHQLLATLSGVKNVSDRERLSRSVKELVEKQFAARQLIRDEQLKSMEEQMKRLRAVHALRAEQKDKIVSDRVEHLLKESQGLGWGGGLEEGDGGEWRQAEVIWQDSLLRPDLGNPLPIE